MLRSLHWLPVKFRIMFKITLLTCKTLNALSSLHACPVTPTQIKQRNQLSVLRVKVNAGARAFHSCALSLWNNLPLSVCSATSVAIFRKHLKTHLSGKSCVFSTGLICGNPHFAVNRLDLQAHTAKKLPVAPELLFTIEARICCLQTSLTIQCASLPGFSSFPLP